MIRLYALVTGPFSQLSTAPWLCRLRNREQYQDFLKALNLYASEIVSKSELQQMVHDILARYPDLMVCLL